MYWVDQKRLLRLTVHIFKTPEPICANSSSENVVKQIKLECGPMPNVMAALPNIGGVLYSTPQSLADAHCWSTVQ